MGQSYTITFTDSPSPDDVRTMRAGLRAYNVKQEPALLDLPSGEFAIFLRDKRQQIQGGIVAEIDWGMMYVDLLWLDDSLRGKNLGKALLATIEQTTLKLGLSHIYLMTTEFQALKFYQHLGYELFGTLMNRPHGYAYYYLRKMTIEPDDTDYGLTLIENPTANDKRQVIYGLRDYCERFVDCTAQRLAGFIYDDDGIIRGGIFGSTYWDWFDLRYLWVDESLHGQGYGKKLLAQAEAESRKRGMSGIVCDTADFQALPFYQSQGFEVFGTMPNRPPNHTSYYVKKLLT